MSGYEGEKTIIVGECHILFYPFEVEIVYDLLSSLSLEEGERDTRAINFWCV